MVCNVQLEGKTTLRLGTGGSSWRSCRMVDGVILGEIYGEGGVLGSTGSVAASRTGEIVCFGR